ncbi:hypothetical protein JCM8202v2_004302 [Rhodotorula sphaerocarpa]
MASTQEAIATTAPADPAVPALAVHRHSPRPCVNQALVDELATLRAWRFLQYGTGHEKFISYARAVSVIIGTPFKIQTVEQARKLPKIGDKLITKIEKFLKTGRIQAAHDVLASERFRVLSLLSEVQGIGPAKAKQLYDEKVVRSLEDLSRLSDLSHSLRRYIRKFHPDLTEKILRREVESIHNFIKLQIDRVQPLSHTLLCGGQVMPSCSYRRGKGESNDITWPHQEGVERGKLREIVDRLSQKGFIPNGGVLSLTEAGTNRTVAANRPASRIDALDRALLIFKHPPDVASERMEPKYRRVDLVVSRPGSWGCAVVGWTGSTQFERDLRLHAQKKGFKFDSGGIRTQAKDQPVEVATEQDVFRVLGLEYIRPELRNADP